MDKCIKCGVSLRRIGSNRGNGKLLSNRTGTDWADRKLHKKCWKKLKVEQDTILFSYYDEISEDDKRCMIARFKTKYGLVKLL